MANHSKERTQAEAQFKQAHKAQAATQPTTGGGKATADYVAAGHAVRAKTARLKELRLAKEATDKTAEPKHVSARRCRREVHRRRQERRVRGEATRVSSA
jgi:hypothetical protein